MTISIKHSTTMTASDDPNAEINKAQWNDEHPITMATGKLLGRSTASTGDVEEITPGTGLSLSGGNLSVSATLDDLSGVVITTPSNGQVLKYNSGSGNWINDTDATGAGGDTDLAGCIRGLQLQWVSASAVTIGPGIAQIESSGDIVVVSSPVALTGLSFGTSTWGYFYLKTDGTVEATTGAPASPYSGTARSKTADTSRRFLGAVRTDSSGNIYRFYHNPTIGYYRYQGVDTGSSPFRILSNETNTTVTTKSAAAVAPPQSRMFTAIALNLDTSKPFYLGSADYTVSTSAYELNVTLSSGTTSAKTFTFTCDSSQQISYIKEAAGSGGGLYVDVDGFYLER